MRAVHSARLQVNEAMIERRLQSGSL